MVPNKVYTFSTHAPAILGAQIVNAKLLAMMGYDGVPAKYQIGSKYRKVFSSLPQGTIDDPRASIYYQFRGENGEEFVLADVWINTPTIKEVSFTRFSIDVEESNQEKMNEVRVVLNSLGIKFSIRMN